MLHNRNEQLHNVVSKMGTILFDVAHNQKESLLLILSRIHACMRGRQTLMSDRASRARQTLMSDRVSPIWGGVRDNISVAFCFRVGIVEPIWMHRKLVDHRKAFAHH